MGFFQELSQAFGMEDAGNQSDDIRGWKVVDDSGVEVGRVDDVLYEEGSEKVRYLVIDLSGRRVLLPPGQVSYDETESRITANGYSRERLLGLRGYDRADWSDETERAHYADFFPGTAAGTIDYDRPEFRGEPPRRIQLLEERLKLGTRAVPTGEAVFTKRPIVEAVEEQISLTEERIQVDRQTVDRPADAAAISDQPETIRVPLYAEEPVVDKQAYIREEVEINKVSETRDEAVRAQLRREELVEGEGQTFAAAEPGVEELRARGATPERTDVDIRPENRGL